MTVEKINPEILERFSSNPGTPIPGQSLTNDPDTPYPWEQPPKFTKYQDALDYLVSELLEEDRVLSLLDNISKGVPISDMTYLILKQGFGAGLFNPDLMLMLAEPLMYFMMAIAEKSGISYVLYEGEHYEKDEPEEDEGEDLPDMIKSKVPKVSKEELEKVELPESVEKKLEEFEPSQSLLAKQDGTDEQDVANKSLLERG
jgi:hypothetical protein